MASKRNKDLYKNLPTLSSNDYTEYLKMVALGFIEMHTHPEDDDIVILNYTNQTIYDRHWNKYTMSARGLILDTSDKYNGIIYILGKPFGKFFNLYENVEYEKDIPFHKPYEVYEKMDGFLGISYYFDDGIRFSTRGRFDSPMAIKANEIWKKQYEKNYNFSLDKFYPATYMAEIIYPEEQIVIDYGDTEALVLLDVNYMVQDLEIVLTYEEIKKEAELLKMPYAKKYFGVNIQDLLQQKPLISADKEGWVIKFENGKRLKVKGDEYMNVHHLKFGVSTKQKFTLWVEGKWEETIMKVEEEYRSEYEHFGDCLDRLLETYVTTIDYLYQKVLKHTAFGGRKEFSKYVESYVIKDYRKFMYMKADGFNDEKMRENIKEFMRKNYKEQLELIDVWLNKK